MALTSCQDQMKHFAARFRGENQQNVTLGIVIYLFVYEIELSIIIFPDSVRPVSHFIHLLVTHVSHIC